MSLLMDLISGLSSFATLHSWFKEQLKNISEANDKSKLEQIDLIFKNKFLSTVQNEHDIEKFDTFIAKHSFQLKDKGLSVLFSEEEKTKAIQSFIKQNPGIDHVMVRKILDHYFNLLNEYLGRHLSFETRFLKKVINEEGKQIVERINFIIKDKTQVENIYTESSYSIEIIRSCNTINSLFLDNIGIPLWKKSVDEVYLIANGLEDILLRIEKMLNYFNVSEINKLSGNDSHKPLESLVKYMLNLAPDFLVELNEYYNSVIVPTVSCITGFEEKGEEFYISIGALGLYNDHSNEKIYQCIMNNLLIFFTKVSEALQAIWKDRNYQSIEDEVSKQMNKHIYYRIKNHFKNENKLMIKTLYKEGKMLDTVLASKLGYEIDYLRKTLYDATRVFLGYRFVDEVSTEIFIFSNYIPTIEQYYDELFGEVLPDEK
ncbi:hypothetical protein UY456_15890 [Paenibacillus polymyxa]|uniref:hypothetical protein n=1 Tax=Paenibacillus polymyxa TaxID=1406 RepID=UPI002AB3ECF6|nr:hypothetical protein [Paenibacillus polymyxa]MDY8094480.1 hypothetical protein [Paenibacillus polymyxa]